MIGCVTQTADGQPLFATEPVPAAPTAGVLVKNTKTDEDRGEGLAGLRRRAAGEDQELDENGVDDEFDEEPDEDEGGGEPVADVATADVGKRDFPAARRRELARRGHALPDGSFPIENEEDLRNAARLAQSGHGDVAAARRLIARRSRELGVVNPLTGGKADKSAWSTPSGQEGPRADAAGHGFTAEPPGGDRIDPGGRDRHLWQQPSASPRPLAQLRTAQGDPHLNPLASSIQANQGRAQVAQIDAATAAAASGGPPRAYRTGQYAAAPGRPSGNPSSRPGDHIAPTGKLPAAPRPAGNAYPGPPPGNAG